MNRAILALFNPLPATATATHMAQLLPAGEFSARDGRPGPGKTWKLDDGRGRALAAQLSLIAASTPISIDYEHQSIMAATNGQPAPSAGYMLRFEWRDHAGLFAQVQWTERALAYIRAGEYRYISPVIIFDADGWITGLHNAALVSTPALLGMAPVQAPLGALAAGQAGHVDGQGNAASPALLALMAQAYQAERLAAGAHVTTVQAVAHVSSNGAVLAQPQTPALPADASPALVALHAHAYQAACMAAGRHLSTLQAVDHVLAQRR